MILKLQALLKKKTLNAQVAQLNLFIFDLNFAMSTFEICQVYPPIEKMDASLAQLQCCVKLSLSTNMIVNIQVIITNI